MPHYTFSDYATVGIIINSLCVTLGYSYRGKGGGFLGSDGPVRYALHFGSTRRNVANAGLVISSPGDVRTETLRAFTGAEYKGIISALC